MKPILICIAGGSASGKTTVVEEIQKKIGKDEAIFIRHDDYYRDQEYMTLEERKTINYDHPDSFDIELLKNDLKKLMNNKAIDTPVYDFTVHNRDPYKNIHIEPKKLIILEGIMSMYDKDIRDLADIKIYVESEADIRFIRRLKRDIKERGRSMDDIINQYLATVKPMYDAYVAPCKRFADIIIPNDNKHDVALTIINAKIKDIIK